MRIFGWFNTQEADEFAMTIAEELASRVPLDEGKRRSRQTPERLQHTHEALVGRASAFARGHKLNWYKKAHLGNTFRWALTAKGYDKEFVDVWTHNILVAVAQSRSR